MKPLTPLSEQREAKEVCFVIPKLALSSMPVVQNFQNDDISVNEVFLCAQFIVHVLKKERECFSDRSKQTQRARAREREGSNTRNLVLIRLFQFLERIAQ